MASCSDLFHPVSTRIPWSQALSVGEKSISVRSSERKVDRRTNERTNERRRDTRLQFTRLSAT